MRYKYDFNILMPVISIFLILSTFLVSCSNDINEEVSLSPTPMIFEDKEQHEAIYSGNLLYGQTIVSNGTDVFYVSRDGQNLMKYSFGTDSVSVLSVKSPLSLSCSSDMVFFISGSTEGPIYKVDIDGQGETMITDSIAVQIIATETDVFYLDPRDDSVYRVAHDGSDKRKLFADKATRIMLVNEKLYIVPDESPDKVYYLTKGQIETIVSGSTLPASSLGHYDFGTQALYVNVANDKVYFTDNEYSSIYEFSPQGKVRIILKQNLDAPFIYDNGYIYYIDAYDERRLYKLNTLSGTIDQVVNDTISRFAVIGHSIFYSREEKSAIYRASIGGGNSQKIN